MELRHLRSVVAIAEEANFTRAAARCFVSQSALNHQITALERELGVTLFARTSRRVELTAAGRAFLPGARATLLAADRARAEAIAQAEQVRGTLTVGAIPTVTAVDLAEALGAFRAHHPHVRIRVRGAGSDTLLAGVVEGDIDVAFLGLPSDDITDRVASRVLAREKLVAVVPDHHSLAGLSENAESSVNTLPLSALADQPFVDFPAGTPGRLQSDEAFAGADLPRDVSFEAADTSLMLDFVRSGLAVAILPAGVVPRDTTVRTIALADGPERVEHLAWSAFNPSPAAQAFLTQLGAAEDSAPG